MKKGSRTGSLFTFLGYTALLLQWLWLVVLGTAAALDTNALQNFLTSRPAETRIDYRYEVPELLRTPLVAIVLVTMVLLSVYFMVRAPQKAGKLTIHSTERLAKKSFDAMAHRMHVPKPFKIQFDQRILFATQCSLAVIAWLGVYAVSGLVHELSPQLQHVVAGGLCVVSVTCFSLHFLVGYYGFRR